MVGLFWSERGEEQARSSLRQSLSGLRKALGEADGSLLIAGRDTVSLDAEAVEVDASAFERFIDEGTPAALERAAELYRGNLLDGIGVHDPAFENWLRDQRQRFKARACEALSRLLDLQSAGGTESAIAAARRRLALDPLRETTHRTLMRLYADKGERTQALKQYQARHDALASELGLSPEPETGKLAETIRAGAVEIGGFADAEAELPVREGEPSARPGRPSIAVLPFVNMSDDPEQQYFSDGVTEDITTELSRFGSINVLARHSTFVLRDRSENIREAVAALGADYLLEGSIGRSGNRNRLTAQLVDVGSQKHVWAHRYDRELAEVFAIQDELVHAIVATLVGRLETNSLERALRKPPESLAVYDHYLRGPVV